MSGITSISRDFCLKSPVSAYSATAHSTVHAKLMGKNRGYLCFAVFNALRPRQNGRHFADDTFKRIFMNENVRISINISLKFVPKGIINNIPVLVQIMAWRRPGDKPLSETMMVNLLTLICVTRPQWVNWLPIDVIVQNLCNTFDIYEDVNILYSVAAQTISLIFCMQCGFIHHIETLLIIVYNSLRSWKRRFFNVHILVLLLQVWSVLWKIWL